MNKEWELLFEDYSSETKLKDIKKKAASSFEKYGVYPNSIQMSGSTVFFITKGRHEKSLVLFGSDEYFSMFDGEEKAVFGFSAKVCRLNNHNCVQMRKLFSYLNPESRGERRFSIGLGDRLGIASPGHIRLINQTDAFPILAQQSVRELNLTGRTFESVLDDACWGVFQEGYMKGFGADADHLKTHEEVRLGLSSGYSMITLDCSEYIDNKYFDMDEDELIVCYEKYPESYRNSVEAEYLNGPIEINRKITIEFSKAELMKTVLVYGPAIDFINSIYHDIIAPSKRNIDFEVSIDETSVPTTPEAHYFIGSELKNRAVKVVNMAPRFCGEFQKGIDYIGNVGDFEKQFIIHEKIAEYFGYRISVHSGSDKFTVFPVIGEHTKLNVHVKTAGTNWLEALRVISEKNPGLFRRIAKFAYENLNEAKKYYHIKANPDTVPDIDGMQDKELHQLLVLEDPRQVLHITYGLVLQEKNEDGSYAFRDEIYQTLHDYEDDYYNKLFRHIGKHLNRLGAIN